MRKLVLFVSAVALAGVLVASCSDDGEVNECNEAAAVMATTVDAYCSGRDGECWACDCYNQGMMAVETGTASPMTFECQTIARVCDATNMDLAENCLADEAQCATDAEASMTASCGTTAK